MRKGRNEELKNKYLVIGNINNKKILRLLRGTKICRIDKEGNRGKPKNCKR